MLLSHLLKGQHRHLSLSLSLSLARARARARALSESSEKIERQVWFDHFQQLFSQADGGISRECSELDDEVNEIFDLDSDVLNQPISEAEVRAAVSKLKTGTLS